MSKDIEVVISELREFMALEGTELSDCIREMISLHRYSYIISEGLKAQLESDLRFQLKEFESNYKVETVKEVIPERTRSYQELVYIGD